MRTNRVEIRLNDSEVARLNGMRGSMRLRTFVRFAVLGKVPPIVPEINQLAIAELSRIGNNINQIARFANTTGSLGDDLVELNAQISALRLALIEAKK